MYKKILIPIDISREKNTIRLCATAKSLASDSTEVRLLSVLPGYGMSLVASYFPEDAEENAKSAMKEELEKVAQEHFSDNDNVSFDVLHGKRVQEILAEADVWQPDLILIGSRMKATRFDQRLLGTTSSGVADRAKCSVLIVR